MWIMEKCTCDIGIRSQKTREPIPFMKPMASDKETHKDAKVAHHRKTWGLTNLWSHPRPTLPQLLEAESENDDSAIGVTSNFSLEDSFSADGTLESLNKRSNQVPVVILSSDDKRAAEAPEPLYGRTDELDSNRGLRRIQSFDELMLGQLSDIPIPSEYLNQEKGFCSSLYGSLQELHFINKGQASQPSSASSSRCSTPTKSLTDKVIDNQIVCATEPVKHPRRLHFFRDLNATAPTSW